SAQRMEMRFTAIKDWVFYALGEWEEEWGKVDEFQNMDEELPLDKDTYALGQKYSVGFTWYPLMRLNCSGESSHGIAHDQDNNIASELFPTQINKDWRIDDFNLRMTCLLKTASCLGTLVLDTRYDFVRSSIDNHWGIYPQPDMLVAL